MHNILLIIFIFCVFAILHSYVFYPALLILFAPKRDPGKMVYSANDDLPEVSILMAAYNEEKVINEKIKSVFDTAYPLNKITFYIGSDASNDGTDEIVKDWAKKYRQVKLIEFKGRTGKSGIINQLAQLSNSEIFILTDANVMFKRETIFNLVRHFKNKNKAQVCANIIKVSDLNSGIASQEKSYIALENKIKYSESLAWNIVMGAEGACYSIRKENFAPVPPKFYMDDFFITMNVIEQGKEIVFDKEAVCYEDVPTQSSEEFKRKVRISIGNFQNLFRYKKLLLPVWKGSAFAFWSHKVFRWLTPFFLIASLTASVFLALSFKHFIIIALLQVIGFLMPVFDKMLNINFKPIRFISHFYLMNLALLKGFLIFVKGVQSNVWQPTKRNV
jgi:cellulose synthase/poly-beta-1,6-N-acetylglucosamine synthase-like glycosyltransferase